MSHVLLVSYEMSVTICSTARRQNGDHNLTFTAV